jgi:hypothetical protein
MGWQLECGFSFGRSVVRQPTEHAKCSKTGSLVVWHVLRASGGIQPTGRTLKLDQSGLGNLLKGSLISNLMKLQKNGFDEPISRCDSSGDSGLLLFGVADSNIVQPEDLPYVVCYSTKFNAPIWTMHMLRRGVKVVQSGPDDANLPWKGMEKIENPKR